MNSSEILNKIPQTLKNLKEKNPLTQCITNYVTVNDVANGLLAIGASPLMSEDPQEQKDIVNINDSLVINIGTLTKSQIEGMYASLDEADNLYKPVIFDPVGAGASELRTNTSVEIINNYSISVIRGNMSEIKILAKEYNIDIENEETVKGVDVAPEDIISKENIKVNGRIVKELAEKINVVVMASGHIDIISDGKNVYTIKNGDPLMSRITGSGCMLTGINGGFIGSNDDILLATITGALSIGIAGELSAEYIKNNALGSGSFRTRLIDELYKLNSETLLKRAKLENLEI